MSTSNLNPNHFFQFDFNQGSIHTQDGKKVVVLPEESFFLMLSKLPQPQSSESLSQLGTLLGQFFKKNNEQNFSVETSIQTLNAVLCLFGFGTVVFERWGDALAFQITASSDQQEQFKSIRLLLEAMLRSSFDDSIRCVPVERGRLLIVHESIASQVRSWTQQGFTFGQILDRLN